MAERSFLVRLRANIDDFRSQMRAAEDAARGVGKGSEQSSQQATTALGRMTASARNNRQEWMVAGRTLTMFGAAVVGAMGLAVKAAVDWESAWVGVEKVLDGTNEEFAQLEGELRDLTAILPASHGEIAAVAQAAGQLGVGVADVAEFTRVMINMGEATNLSAAEAAFAIARMANIMGTSIDDVERLGSTIVDLGNNSATTEADIMAMALRIAGAGNTIGMSEADVLAFAAAISSVGIAAAAGGTSISRSFIEISNAVNKGGEDLAAFARVADMSAADFAAAFDEDPARAMLAFIQGLDGISESGENVFAVLDELGLGEIRVRDALLRLAGDSDRLAASLDISAEAWDANTALAEEAGRRYDTTAAKMSIARNQVVDAAISFGELLLPALAGAAEALANVAQWFGNLPDPVKQVITAVGGVVGVTALAAGGFLMLFPRIIDTVDALNRLHTTMPGASRALRRLAIASGVGAALSLVVAGLDAVNRSAGSGIANIEDTTRALLDMHDGSIDTAAGLDAMFRQLESGRFEFDTVHSFADALDRIVSPGFGNRLEDVAGSITSFGRGTSKELEEVHGQFEAIDSAMAHLVQSGRIAEAQELFDEMAAATRGAGHEVSILEELLPGYAEALQGVENAARQGTDTGEGFAAALDLQAAAADMATEEFEHAQQAVEDLVSSWAEALAGFADPVEAWEAANQRAAEAAAEAAGESKDAWQEFADEATASIGQFIAELERQVEAQQNWATNIATIAARGFEGLARVLMDAGPEAAGLVAELVDATDDELARTEELLPHTMADGMQATADEMRKWIPIAGEVADEFGQDVADRIAAEIAAGETTVEEAMGELNRGIEENVPGDIEITVLALDDPFWERAGLVQSEADDLDGLLPTPTITADPDPFFERSGLVREEVEHVDSQRPQPIVFLDIDPFQTEWGQAMADVLELDSETPTPAADMDLALFWSMLETAERQLDDFDESTATPEAILEHQKFTQDVEKARGLLEDIKDREVAVTLNDQASGGISNIFNLLSQLRDRTVTVTTQHRNEYYSRPREYGRATGGPVWPGQMYMVGERGEELFSPQVPGSIVPNHDLMSARNNDTGTASGGGFGEPGFVVGRDGRWWPNDDVVDRDQPMPGVVIDQHGRWVPDEDIPFDVVPDPGFVSTSLGWLPDDDIPEHAAPAAGFYIDDDAWIPANLDTVETIEMPDPAFVLTDDGWLPANMPESRGPSGGGSGRGGSGRGGGGGGGGWDEPLIPPGDYYGRGEFIQKEWDALMKGVDEYLKVSEAFDHSTLPRSHWGPGHPLWETEKRRAANSLRLHRQGRLPMTGKFDQGGLWPTDTLGLNQSGSVEYVFNQGQWGTLERLASRGAAFDPQAIADAIAAAMPVWDGATLQLQIGSETVFARVVADGQRDRTRTGARS